MTRLSVGAIVGIIIAALIVKIAILVAIYKIVVRYTHSPTDVVPEMYRTPSIEAVLPKDLESQPARKSAAGGDIGAHPK
ncbi:hypothetical protein ONZ45_g14996 [Pleurotus djamor]|nr:hypothetical protein ONZ45_g14996 [Pleurotus djamor]